MEPILHEALLEEAQRVGVVDPDILAAFPEEIATAKLDASGAPDVGSVVAAIRKIKTRSPALFKEQDYSKMSSAEMEVAESKFRDSLRRRSKPEARTSEAFKKLDAALLSPEEDHALRRYLSGTRSSYDLSVLSAALKRQNGPDAA